MPKTKISESAKARYREQASREASERHAQIVGDYEAETKEMLEANERRLFSLSYPEGVVTDSQKEAFRSAYRSSSFSCLNLPEDGLERMMTRASRMGDRALEQAVYHESVERGLFSLANEYRERHPEAAEAWEIYSKARRRAQSNEALLGRALLSNANPASSEE